MQIPISLYDQSNSQFSHLFYGHFQNRNGGKKNVSSKYTKKYENKATNIAVNATRFIVTVGKIPVEPYLIQNLLKVLRSQQAPLYSL